MLWWVVLTGCGGSDRCDDGEVRDGERCVPYRPGDPEPSEAIPITTGATWQWQLTGQHDLTWDVDVYDLDLFRIDEQDVATVHGDGRLLLCYFSAGSYEPWRPDADAFPEEVIGKGLDGWPDERWVDHTDPRVRAIMTDRMDLAVQLGCDGIEPDNVTAYQENNGFGLSATEQLDYNRFLADEAHARGLGIALKNDVEQVKTLVDWFDYAVNEECYAYDECQRNRPFVDADKAVLNAEYVDRWKDAEDLAAEVCGGQPGLSTIVKTWDLGPELVACAP